MSGISMANILRHSDARRALAVCDHTISHVVEIRNAIMQRFEVSALAGSSYPLRRLGRPAEARQRLDTAFERLRQLKFYPAEKIEPGSEADEVLSALAEHEAETGNAGRALEVYQKLLDLIAAAKPKPESTLKDAVDLSRIYAAKSVLHRRAGQADLASSLDTRRRDLWRQWDGKLPNNTFVRRQQEAASLP